MSLLAWSKKNWIVLITSLFLVACLILLTDKLWVIIGSRYFACSSINKEWEKYGDAPVYGDAETGTVFDPFVYIQNDSLVMSVSERSSGNIIRLTSIDGIKWTRTDTMLFCSFDSWQAIVNRACVLFRDSLWHMWYTGQSNDVSMIGHAVSVNGYSFEKDSCPVLQSTSKEEGVSVMNPCVIWDSNTHLYQMWYAAGENYEPDRLYYAESVDGRSWAKRKNPVLSKKRNRVWEKSKVGGCYVIKNEDQYEMYYIGYKNVNEASICYAVSNDGVLWKRPLKNVLLTPSKGMWDSLSIYKPTVINWKGGQYLWYNGRNLSGEFIGLALRMNNVESRE